MIPIADSVTISDDPPKLTNGSGMPVIGRSPVTAAMLMTACERIIDVSPAASSLP
jgi:hypothetical protein